MQVEVVIKYSDGTKIVFPFEPTGTLESIGLYVDEKIVMHTPFTTHSDNKALHTICRDDGEVYAIEW